MARTISTPSVARAATWIRRLLLVAAVWHVPGCEDASAPRDAQAAPAAAMKPYTEKIPGTGVAFDMVPVPAGRFLMGSPASEPNRSKDEGPQFEAELAPFWMGKCEVTWDEFDMWAVGLDRHHRKTPDAQRTGRDRRADAVTSATPPYGDSAFGMGREGYPAISMSQLAAKMYCKWLSAKTGRFYRLPTEAPFMHLEPSTAMGRNVNFYA